MCTGEKSGRASCSSCSLNLLTSVVLTICCLNMCSRLSCDNQSTMSDSRQKHPIKQTRKSYTNKRVERGERTDPLVVLTSERASVCVCVCMSGRELLKWHIMRAPLIDARFDRRVLVNKCCSRLSVHVLKMLKRRGRTLPLFARRRAPRAFCQTANVSRAPTMLLTGKTISR